MDAVGHTVLYLWREDQELHDDATESDYLVENGRVRSKREQLDQCTWVVENRGAHMVLCVCFESDFKRAHSSRWFG